MVRGRNGMLVRRNVRPSPGRQWRSQQLQQQDRTMEVHLELKLALKVLRTVVALRRLPCWTLVIAFALSAELRHCHSHFRCRNRTLISVLKRAFFLERKMNDVCL